MFLKQNSSNMDVFLHCIYYIFTLWQCSYNMRSSINLKVIYLEDGFWVRQVVFLQVCIQAGFWRTEIWNSSSFRGKT